MAIQSHHRKEPSAISPLVRALAGGQDIALRFPEAPAEEILAPAPYQTGLELAGISEIFAGELMERTEAAASGLRRLLSAPLDLDAPVEDDDED